MGKTRSTLVMDEDLWKRFKMIAILNNMEVSELVEQALREKLERMKQLEQYPEYKDVRNLLVHKGEQPQEEPVIHSSKYEAAKSDAGALPQLQPQPQPKTVLIDINLPGIEFPTDKSKIIKIAEEANTDRVNNVLKLISVRKYKNKSDLENELLNNTKDTRVDFIKEGGTIIFKIDNRKLRREQYKEKILEQENKINIK
jgi:CheY-like chemotaxis protein